MAVLLLLAGAAFDLKLQRPGEDKRVRFDAPGTVMVGCDSHPGMALGVTVK